jgi:hypothetical protein
MGHPRAFEEDAFFDDDAFSDEGALSDKDAFNDGGGSDERHFGRWD